MQHVYLTYASEDLAFARRLMGDLTHHNIQCTLADSDSPEQFEALAQADVVLVALTTAAARDARVLATLDAATKSQKRIIALRTGVVAEQPKALKGMLPLDFSDDELYEGSLITLLEDLQPPEPPQPLLPPNIQTALDSDDPNRRKQGIEMLGALRQNLDPNIREMAQQTLRDLAFKDPEGGLKGLARNTLQLFDADSKAQTEPEEAEDSLAVVEDNTEPGREALEAAQPIHMAGQIGGVPIWATNDWWYLPIVGALLSLLHALLANELLVVVSTASVWIILPWFNVLVRDGGRMDWKMPGPLIGNAVVALVVSLLALGLGQLVGRIRWDDFLAAVGVATINGGYIGWMSSLYKH